VVGRSPITLVALALASTVLTLAGLETFARIVWQPPGAISPRGPVAGGEALPELRGFDEIDRPNARGIYQGVVYRMNGAGMRGDEVALAKPPGVVRIGATGDSVTMGVGVPVEHAYPAALERMPYVASGEGS
jgi:hypothetical protein